MFCLSGGFDEQGRVILQSARTSLDQYGPADPREQSFRERMLELLQGPAPTSRSQFAPGHLTASAFVVTPEHDAVLLIFHKKLRIWIQPGGHIESSDDSLESAARRELLEEVGLALPPSQSGAIFDLDIHQIPARKAEPAHEHFDVRFRFTAPSRSFRASEEVADARWVQLDQIDQVTSDESVLRAVRKLRTGREAL